MKRIILCLSLFAFFGSQAQQINPVPDYVFSNKMSVGRNAVTDTAAYFSIGPRYGAIRGMMPPMVTDTASMSATKRNGLLIFSIQKNKYLYWDSVGSKWAEMAGTTGTALTSGDTASMLSPYIRAAGNGLTKSGQSLLVDTAAIATRARVQKAVDSLGAVKGSGTVTSVSAGTGMSFTTITTTGSVAADTTVLSTRAWRRKGLDSLAALELSLSDTASMLTPYTRGSGTTNYLPKFTGTRTFGNSVAFDNGGTELLVNTTTDAGAYALQVNGNSKFNGIDITTLDMNTSGQRYRFSTRYGANSDGKNIWIGDGGNSSIGQAGQTFRGSQNTSIGVNAMYEATTGYDNTAIGVSAMQFLTVGYNNMAMGGFALRYLSSGYSNIGIGYMAGTNLTIGNQNIAIGQDALRFTNSGTAVDSVTNSIYVGHDSRPSAKTNTNEIVIGYQGRGNGSNTTTIGNTSTVGTYFPAGEMYVNTTTDAGAYALQVAGAIYNTTTITTGAPTGGSIKPWRLGEAATVSPTSPNRTIRVEIDGTVYYIHAKTTND